MPIELRQNVASAAKSSAAKRRTKKKKKIRRPLKPKPQGLVFKRGAKHPTHTIYFPFTHIPESCDFLGREIEKAIQGRSVKKINIFAEICGGSKEERKYIEIIVNDFLENHSVESILDFLAQSEPHHPTITNIIRKHLEYWPIFQLIKLREQTKVSFKFNLIDISEENPHYSLIEQANAAIRDFNQLFSQQTENLADLKERLSQFKVNSLTGIKQIIQTRVAEHQLRNPLVRRELDQKMPLEAAQEGVMNMVWIGANHFEQARGANLKPHQQRIFVFGSEDLNNRLPPWFRTVHSNLLGAIANKLNYKGVEPTAIDLKRVLLFYLIRNGLGWLLANNNQSFAPQNHFLFGLTACESLATRVVWKMTPKEVEETFEDAFNPKEFSDQEVSGKSLKSYFDLKMGLWLLDKFYPYRKGIWATFFGRGRPDPSKIPQVFDQIIDQYF